MAARKRLRLRSLTNPDAPFREEVWGNRYRIERRFRTFRGSSSSSSEQYCFGINEAVINENFVVGCMDMLNSSSSSSASSSSTSTSSSSSSSNSSSSYSSSSNSSSSSTSSSSSSPNSSSSSSSVSSSSNSSSSYSSSSFSSSSSSSSLSSSSSMSNSSSSSSSSSNACNQNVAYYTGSVANTRGHIVSTLYPDGYSTPFYTLETITTTGSQWEDPDVFVIDWQTAQGSLSAISLPLAWTHPVFAAATGVSDPVDFETNQFNLSVYTSQKVEGSAGAENTWTFVDFVSVAVPSSISVTFDLTHFIFDTPIACISGNYYAFAMQQPYYVEDMRDRTGVVTASTFLSLIIQGLSSEQPGVDFDVDYRDWEYVFTATTYSSLNLLDQYRYLGFSQFFPNKWYHYAVGLTIDGACNSSSSSSYSSSSYSSSSLSSSSSSFSSSSSSSTSNSSSSSSSNSAAPPTLQSATVEANGTTITMVFSQAVEIGAGGDSGWTVLGDFLFPPENLTYISGATTTTLTWTLAGPGVIVAGDNISLSYSQPGNGVEKTSDGVDLDSIITFNATNNSIQ